MAMVIITNGETTSKVPAAAYRSTYKNLGFRLVGEEIAGEVVPNDGGATEDKQNGPETTPEEQADNKNKDVESEDAEEEEDDTNNETEEDENDDEAFVEDILEKPLSQWSKNELQKFVTIKEIDITGATKTSEVRAIVKEFLEAQDKASVNS